MDRRVRRTVTRLRAALFELIEIKSYDRITVQDLLDRADVGRSTFYAHFPSKDALLMSGPPPGAEHGEEQLTQMLTPSGAPSVVGLFEHAAQGYHLFEALAGTSAMEVFLTATKERLEAQLRAWFEQQRWDQKGSLDPAAAARFHAAGTMAVILSWLSQGMPRPAAQVARECERWWSVPDEE